MIPDPPIILSRQKESGLLSKMLTSRGQKHRVAKRPDHQVNPPQNSNTLSNPTETNYVSGRRTTTNVCIPDQQLSTGCIDHLPTLQTPLADRTILQVDQAVLANQVVLQYVNQRCQDTSLDRNQCVCACSDYQKGTELGAFATRNTPNYLHPAFRENPAKTSTYGESLCF